MWVDDETAVALAKDAQVVAIDAPLGWPVAFGAAIAAHQRREAWPVSSVRELSYRQTDLFVRDAAGCGRSRLAPTESGLWHFGQRASSPTWKRRRSSTGTIPLG